MKILEIIEFRSSSNKQKDMSSLIQCLIKEAKEEASQNGIAAYSNVRLNTDFSIHLTHNSIKTVMRESTLGLRLASSLKEFGFVNHSIWTYLGEKNVDELPCKKIVS